MQVEDDNNDDEKKLVTETPPLQTKIYHYPPYSAPAPLASLPLVPAFATPPSETFLKSLCQPPAVYASATWDKKSAKFEIEVKQETRGRATFTASVEPTPENIKLHDKDFLAVPRKTPLFIQAASNQRIKFLNSSSHNLIYCGYTGLDGSFLTNLLELQNLLSCDLTAAFPLTQQHMEALMLHPPKRTYLPWRTKTAIEAPVVPKNADQKQLQAAKTLVRQAEVVLMDEGSKENFILSLRSNRLVCFTDCDDGFTNFWIGNIYKLVRAPVDDPVERGRVCCLGVPLRFVEYAHRNEDLREAKFVVHGSNEDNKASVAAAANDTGVDPDDVSFAASDQKSDPAYDADDDHSDVDVLEIPDDLLAHLQESDDKPSLFYQIKADKCDIMIQQFQIDVWPCRSHRSYL
jgi:hypothetical protein